METIGSIPTPPRITRSSVGHVGLWLSLVAPVVLLVMIVNPPGWGSPFAALGGLTILVTPPVALVLSIVGLIRGGKRTAAIAGIVISGLLLLLIAGGFALSLCR